MTFEQFIATRKWSDNLAVDLDHYSDLDLADVQPGFIYDGSLYIEEVADWWPQDARDQGRWHLLIERSDYITNDIAALERRLYRWAMSAGFDETGAGEAQLSAWADEAYAIAAKWVAKIGGGFHPDTRGKDYVWIGTGGNRMFSDAEAAAYDADMERLFAIAADPYDTAVAAMHDANEGETQLGPKESAS